MFSFIFFLSLFARKKREKIEWQSSATINVCNFFQFSTYIFSDDIIPEMLKLCRVTKLKVFFPVLVYVFNFDLFGFSAAILEKGLLDYVIAY